MPAPRRANGLRALWRRGGLDETERRLHDPEWGAAEGHKADTPRVSDADAERACVLMPQPSVSLSDNTWLGPHNEISGVDRCSIHRVLTNANTPLKLPMARSRHPKKEVEDAVQYAEEAGWSWQPSGGHAWGRLLCSKGCCQLSVWSTPRSPGDHGRQICRKVDRCPGITSEEGEE